MRRLVDRPAQELERRDKAKAQVKTIERRLSTNVNVVAEKPLSLAEQRARSRWQRPVAAIIAGVLAETCGLRDRMSRSILAPDRKNLAIYQATFNELWQATNKQIEALEVFARIDWE